MEIAGITAGDMRFAYLLTAILDAGEKIHLSSKGRDDYIRTLSRKQLVEATTITPHQSVIEQETHWKTMPILLVEIDGEVYQSHTLTEREDRRQPML